MAEHYMPTPEEIERLKQIIFDENVAAGIARRCGGWHNKKRGCRVAKAVIPDEGTEDEIPDP